MSFHLLVPEDPLEPEVPEPPELPEVPEEEPEEPMLPEPPEELELPAGEPPEVSEARRSQPTTVNPNAATTSKTFDVVTSDFILVPFHEKYGCFVLMLRLVLVDLVLGTGPFHLR